MFQFFERTINWIVSWTKWSIVTQEFINVTTHYFVSHLLSNVGLDVTLADTANIAFHTPWDLLCQSAVNQRQIMLDGHTHRRLLDPSWPSQTGRNGWPLYRSTKEWKRCQVPGARCRKDNARVAPSTFHFFDNLLAKVKVQWDVKSSDGGVIHLSHTPGGWSPTSAGQGTII